MKCVYLALGAALALIAAPASAALYDISPSVTAATGGNTILSASGQSNIQATTTDSYNLLCDDGGSYFQVARLDAFASTEGNTRDPFNTTYTVTINLTDIEQPGQGAVTFQGRLTGYLAQRQDNLVNTWEGPHVKQVTINGTVVTVMIGPFAAPAPPIASTPGALMAYITCAPTATGVSTVSLTPSPAKTGDFVQGTVTLNGPAPRGGALVDLTSGVPAALGLPANVLVPEGATSATFFAAARAEGTAISVQARWNGSTASQAVSVGGGVCGDFNGNGTAGMDDVVRLLRGVAGLDTLPDC